MIKMRVLNELIDSRIVGLVELIDKLDATDVIEVGLESMLLDSWVNEWAPLWSFDRWLPISFNLLFVTKRRVWRLVSFFDWGTIWWLRLTLSASVRTKSRFSRADTFR